MRGMRTSMRIRSGYSREAICTASSPLVAATTSYPANLSVKATRSRISGSSSAINIFGIQPSISLLNRQSKREGAAFARQSLDLHPKPSVMHLNQLAYNRQPQAGARRGQHQRMFAAIETFKDAFLIRRRNAYTVVLHIHLNFLSIESMQADFDGSILRCVMIGIIHKVIQYLAHAFRIAADMRQGLGSVQRERHGFILFLRAAQNIRDHIFGDLTQVQ